MPKLRKRYWLETDDLFNTTGNKAEKITKSLLPTVFPYANSPLGTTTPTLSRLENFPRAANFVKNQHQRLQLKILNFLSNIAKVQI